jgi:hypothetical protein
MERARARLIAFAGICGGVIILLSFASWIHFSTIEYEETGGEAINPVSIDLAGTETARSRDRENLLAGDVPEEENWCSCQVDFGDGYVTAGLGAFVIVSAAGALATRRDRVFAMGIIAGSLGALLLAGYNALGEWHAIAWTRLGQTEFVDGSVEPALWALLLVAVISTVTGAALWTHALLEEEDEWDEEWDDEDLQAMNSTGQGANTWA